MTAATTLDNSERTPCEVWSRCMGYHRPVAAWNPGKQQEHRDRRYFKEQPNGPDDLSSFRARVQSRL